MLNRRGFLGSMMAASAGLVMGLQPSNLFAAAPAQSFKWLGEGPGALEDILVGAIAPEQVYQVLVRETDYRMLRRDILLYEKEEDMARMMDVLRGIPVDWLPEGAPTLTAARWTLVADTGALAPNKARFMDLSHEDAYRKPISARIIATITE